MMENGELLAADVLPKVAKEMKAVAAVGLESKLDTLRVAQGQFFNELEKTNNTIFQGGFSEGLKDLFQTLTQSVQVNQDTLKNFGEIFKTVFTVVESVYKSVSPIFMAMIDVLGGLFGALDKTFGEDTVENITKAITAIVIALSPLLRTVTAIVAAFDFLMSFFESGKMNIIEEKLGKDVDLSEKGFSKSDLLNFPKFAYKSFEAAFMGGSTAPISNPNSANQQTNTFYIESKDPDAVAREVQGVLNMYSQGGLNVGY